MAPKKDNATQESEFPKEGNSQISWIYGYFRSIIGLLTPQNYELRDLSTDCIPTTRHNPNTKHNSTQKR